MVHRFAFGAKPNVESHVPRLSFYGGALVRALSMRIFVGSDMCWPHLGCHSTKCKSCSFRSAEKKKTARAWTVFLSNPPRQVFVVGYAFSVSSALKLSGSRASQQWCSAKDAPA